MSTNILTYPDAHAIVAYQTLERDNAVAYWSGKTIRASDLSHNGVFVFGSNPEGRHGKGAALAAQKFGAVYGIGRGLQGQSYALVTKNLEPGFVEPSTGKRYLSAGEKSVSLEDIGENVRELYRFARENTHLRFFVAYRRDVVLLNGWSSEEMFRTFMENDPPENMVFHESYRPSLF